MTDQTPTTAPIITRPAADRFVPRPQRSSESDVVVHRNVLQPTRGGAQPVTARQRQIAGSLPAWDLLPPDELLVRRGL